MFSFKSLCTPKVVLWGSAGVLCFVVGHFASIGDIQNDILKEERRAQKELFTRNGVPTFKGMKLRGDKATVITYDKTAGNVFSTYSIKNGSFVEMTTDKKVALSKPLTPDYHNNVVALIKTL